MISGISTIEVNSAVMSIFILLGFFVVTIFAIRFRYNKLLLDKERQISETKDQLLSIASHQLRTPATGVKQYLGLILDGYAGKVSDRHQKIIEKAYRSNERQLKTINDVLYLARLGSGRIVTTNTKFDVVRMIDDLVDELESDIEKKKHIVNTKFSHKTIEVNADQHLLRMCVENLLTNAIKYTRHGGEIAINVEQKDDCSEIAIKDNGVGIAKEEMDELFKQFNRLPNELSHSTSGSGIGLYLTKHLMLLQGGNISVKSKQHKGSTFTLHLKEC